MKCMVTVVLMLLFSVAAGYAQQNPVKMKYSGSELTTAFLLQGPDTVIAGEEKLAGDGSLGQFTYRAMRGDDGTTLTITDACPNGNIPVTEGEGIFRFSDGSLMTVEITGGSHLHRCQPDRPPNRDVSGDGRDRAFPECDRRA